MGHGSSGRAFAKRTAVATLGCSTDGKERSFKAETTADILDQRFCGLETGGIGLAGVAEKPDPETRAGEGMPPEEFIRDPEALSQLPHHHFIKV